MSGWNGGQGAQGRGGGGGHGGGGGGGGFQADPAAANRRVYVGNLKFEVSWQDLKDLMKSVGTVVRADVMTDAAGRSKGCGLVEFATVEGAQRAILELNDTELQGRPVFVREDRETGAPSAPVVKPMTTLRDPAGLPVVVAKLGLSRHVYVGNLSWDVQWQDLKDHMKTVGEVLHADVLLEATGRSKGCGIVEYANVEGANAAILGLQNSTLKNRPIFVREDRERITKAGGGSGVAAPGDGGAVISGGRLYIGNLDFKVRWFDLKDHFKTIGPVIRADVSMEDDGVRSKGYGIVEYASGQDAAKAIEQLNDSLLNGRPINVREDREEKRRY